MRKVDKETVIPARLPLLLLLLLFLHLLLYGVDGGYFSPMVISPTLSSQVENSTRRIICQIILLPVGSTVRLNKKSYPLFFFFSSFFMVLHRARLAAPRGSRSGGRAKRGVSLEFPLSLHGETRSGCSTGGCPSPTAIRCPPRIRRGRAVSVENAPSNRRTAALRTHLVST